MKFKIDISDVDREDIEAIKDQLFIQFNDCGMGVIESLRPLKYFIEM